MAPVKQLPFARCSGIRSWQIYLQDFWPIQSCLLVLPSGAAWAIALSLLPMPAYILMHFSFASYTVCTVDCILMKWWLLHKLEILSWKTKIRASPPLSMVAAKLVLWMESVEREQCQDFGGRCSYGEISTYPMDKDCGMASHRKSESKSSGDIYWHGKENAPHQDRWLVRKTFDLWSLTTRKWRGHRSTSAAWTFVPRAILQRKTLLSLPIAGEHEGFTRHQMWMVHELRHKCNSQWASVKYQVRRTPLTSN